MVRLVSKVLRQCFDMLEMCYEHRARSEHDSHRFVSLAAGVRVSEADLITNSLPVVTYHYFVCS